MILNDFEIIIMEIITAIDGLFSFITINGITIASWFWWLITQFGDKFIIFGILILFYWCLNKEKGEKIAFSIFISLMVNAILKFFIQRERPFDYLNGKYSHIRKLKDVSLDGASGTSFPSGHSQNAATVFSSVAFHERRSSTLILAIVFITLVPISRVYLGVHYPTDTIVGVLLGILISYLIYLISTYCYNHKYIFYIGFMILMIPFFLINPGSEAAHAIYTSFGLYVGFIIGIFIENKWINFSCNVSNKTKFLRFVIGVPIIVVIYLIYALTKNLLPANELIRNIYSSFGYGTIALFGFGIIPFIFKKQKR